MASEDISVNLPLDAFNAGLRLLWHREPLYKYPDGDRPVGGLESVYLINRHHKALHSWPYVPSLAEVQDISMTILKEGVDND